jgi:hypothetical protein
LDGCAAIERLYNSCNIYCNISPLSVTLSFFCGVTSDKQRRWYRTRNMRGMMVRSDGSRPFAAFFRGPTDHLPFRKMTRWQKQSFLTFCLNLKISKFKHKDEVFSIFLRFYEMMKVILLHRHHLSAPPLSVTYCFVYRAIIIIIINNMI